ncbi:MAG: hypothetical protein AAB363_10860 [Planctomycetota bacterium]
MRYEIPAERPKRGREVETEDYPMNRVKKWSSWAIAIGAILAWNGVARSQTTTPGVPTLGQRASDNVSAGALAARSPGNMVGAGVVRAREAADFARGGIEIVETTRPISPRAVFLVEAIEIIFKQLNLTLLYLGDVLRQRAGLPPLIPQGVPLPPTENVPSDNVDPGEVNVEDLVPGDVGLPQTKSGRPTAADSRL